MTEFVETRDCFAWSERKKIWCIGLSGNLISFPSCFVFCIIMSSCIKLARWDPLWISNRLSRHHRHEDSRESERKLKWKKSFLRFRIKFSFKLLIIRLFGTIFWRDISPRFYTLAAAVGVLLRVNSVSTLEPKNKSTQKHHTNDTLSHRRKRSREITTEG